MSSPLSEEHQTQTGAPYWPPQSTAEFSQAATAHLPAVPPALRKLQRGLSRERKTGALATT